MPVKSYPFIDIAVHERVRDHFARGDAAVLFAPDLSRVLWSNGEGASLFGLASIYDFLDGGLATTGVAFRQMQATAGQLREAGETRRFMMRIPQGFKSMAVNATLSLIEIRPGERAMLFTAPRAGPAPTQADAAARMISGFDDPDTHMAVLDGAGAVLASSAQFAGLGMTQQTLLSLVEAVGRDSDWLLKRPVLTGKGTLPAAIGKVSSDPALHILFAVETILGHMDATADLVPPSPVALVEPEPVEPAATLDWTSPVEAEPVAADEAELPSLPEEDDELKTADPVTDDVVTGDIDGESLPLATDDAGDAPAAHLDSEDTERGETLDSAPSDMPPPVLADGAADSTADDALDEAPVSFRFDPAMRAIRFVWKIGADGRFSEISHDFAAAVGPDAADVIGQSFADLADRFALDPDRTIVDLLNRRDTWSGKTVLWPVQGEALCVPVDLAALPTYSRNREFDGFRGFGIVRISDAVADPAERGRHLYALAELPADDAKDEVEADSAEPAFESPAPETSSPELPPRETLDDSGDFFVTAETDAPDENGVDVSADDMWPEELAPRDPFMGERPALKLVETPSRRHSDKIVQIDTVRQSQPETLTRSEQAAFREIARQLTTTFGKRTEKPVDAETQDPDVPSDASANDVAAFEQDVSEMEVDAQGPADADEARVVDELPEADADQPGEAQEEEAEAADGAEDAPPVSAAPEFDTVNEETPAEAVASPDDAAIEPEPSFTETTTDEPSPAASVDASTGDDEAFDAERPENRLLTAAMVDSLESAVLIHNGDELYHANPAFLSLTGYQTLQDLRVEGGIDALFVGDDEGIVDVPRGAIMMIRNDGRLVPVTARLQSVRFDDKSAALMMSLALVEPTETAPVRQAAETPAELEIVDAVPQVDATLFHQAEAQVQALRIETEELRSILETATDGVVVMGTDGDIRSLNRSANALFNFNDEDVIGKPFATLFAHESQRAVMDYLAGLAGHGVASVLNDGREVIGREASGGFIPLFMTMGRLSSSSGYCAVIRDITQWKRTEEELRSAKRAAETANAHKTDFLARVSHEIRTPLNAIIGFSDMMASEHFGPIGSARYIEYASDIGRSGRHVLDIVNDLLDISKIEAGEMELEFSAVEINEAVSEAVSLVQPQANAQRVIIRTSLSTSVPSVVADNRSIKQIALNILANAIRFTPSGGQIVVSTAYEPSGSVMLRIRDTGIGMTRTELEQAMKPFRQVTSGVRMRGEGTGLGLPLTKAMAEANRALFSINSAPNEGTLVEITFPSQRVLAN
jgi:PAS domain S-box-containing protein